MGFRNHNNHHMREFQKINKYKHQRYYGAVECGKYNQQNAVDTFHTPPYHMRKKEDKKDD